MAFIGKIAERQKLVSTVSGQEELFAQIICLAKFQYALA